LALLGTTGIGIVPSIAKKGSRLGLIGRLNLLLSWSTSLLLSVVLIKAAPPLFDETNVVLKAGCLVLSGAPLTSGLNTVLGAAAWGAAATAGVAAGEGEFVAVGGVSPTVHAFSKKLAVTITPGQ
jgi:hypothetical protein